MRFHIREKAWSLTEDFVIKDDAGRAIFDVHGKFFHVGDNLLLRDHQSRQELIHIKQHLISFRPSYDISSNGQHLANVHKQFAVLHERFIVKGSNGEDLHIQGDLPGWNFSFSDSQGNLMAQVSHQLSLFRGSYAVEIAQGVNVPFVLAVVVVLEMVKEHQEEKRD